MTYSHEHRFLVVLAGILLLACGASQSEPETESEDRARITCNPTSKPPRLKERKSIGEGVWGNVWFWEGDFMGCASGTVTGVTRDVFFFEPVTVGEVRWAHENYMSLFFEEVSAEVVAITTSDPNGFFQLELTAGTYSIFVKEQGFYYSFMSSDFWLGPITVYPNRATYVQFDITYESSQ